MSRFGSSLRQTLRAVLTDRYAVVLMIGAVVLYSFFYPAAYRHQVASNLPIVVVDHDHSSTSRELLPTGRYACPTADLMASRRSCSARDVENCSELTSFAPALIAASITWPTFARSRTSARTLFRAM